MSNLTTLDGIVAFSSGPASVWNNTTQIIPQGVYCYESDTQKAKIADGTHLYTALPYHVGAIGPLGFGEGVQNDGSGNLTLTLADGSLTLSSQGIAVNPTDIIYAVNQIGSQSSGTINLNRALNVWHSITVAGAITIAFENWPATGNYAEIDIELTNGGSASVTLPVINWLDSNGSGQTSTTLSGAGITLQTSGVDFLKIWSLDGGNTFYGKAVR